jgi:tripartite-type tricarboxylate transporter receptor subunit TctC
MHHISITKGAVLLAALFSVVATSTAQNYPTQPIKFIVPFTPGTGMDTIARAVGPKLAERLGQPVVVENKPGASGNIGAESVAHAKPDGHTLLVSANTMLIAANLYKNVPYDPLTDFAPISLAAWGTLMLVANPKTKFNTVEEFVAQAKRDPGKINYGSPGVGTPHHMAMELFKDLTHSNLVHVPYKGTAGAVTDVLSGQINVMFLPIHVAMPHVKAGKLKALAVGGLKRHPAAPDVPTLEEMGVKGAEVDVWYGFLAPKGTPAPILSKLNSELRSILVQPEVKDVLEKQGMDATSSTPQEMQSLMRRDYARWGEVIKKNNITAD